MNNGVPDIICIGLTPALQRTLFVPGLGVGRVNRATRCLLSPGGKACNTGRALTTLGHRAIVTGFSGGTSGAELERQLDRLGVMHDFVHIEEATRICTTVIDEESGETTELVEEAPWPDSAAHEALMTRITAMARDAKAAIIAGALPPGADDDTYAGIVEALNSLDVPVFIDSSGPPMRRACEEGPFFAKLNREEYAGMDGTGDSFASEVLKHGAQAFLVTDGANATTLYAADGTSQLTPPRIDAVSAIGSGDAVLSGVVHAWLDGRDLNDAIRFGLACGTANALTAEPCAFDPAQAERFYAIMERR